MATPRNNCNEPVTRLVCSEPYCPSTFNPHNTGHVLCRTHALCAEDRRYHLAPCQYCRELLRAAQEDSTTGNESARNLRLWIRGMRNRKGWDVSMDFYVDPIEKQMLSNIFRRPRKGRNTDDIIPSSVIVSRKTEILTRSRSSAAVPDASQYIMCESESECDSEFESKSDREWCPKKSSKGTSSKTHPRTSSKTHPRTSSKTHPRIRPKKPERKTDRKTCVICGKIKCQGIFEKYKISEDRAAKFLEATVFLQDDVYRRTCDLKDIYSVLVSDLLCHERCIIRYMVDYERACFNYRGGSVSRKKEAWLEKYFSSVHAVVKPHSCSICGKSFSCKSDLNTHSLIHEEVKSHSCSISGESFTVKANLTSHSVIHKGFIAQSCKDGRNEIEETDLGDLDRKKEHNKDDSLSMEEESDRDNFDMIKEEYDIDGFDIVKEKHDIDSCNIVKENAIDSYDIVKEKHDMDSCDILKEENDRDSYDIVKEEHDIDRCNIVKEKHDMDSCDILKEENAVDSCDIVKEENDINSYDIVKREHDIDSCDIVKEEHDIDDFCQVKKYKKM